jgi:hypothetical protein
MTAYPQPSLVGQLLAQVAPAETAFRSRWRLQSLQRIDPELHGLLVEQIQLYERSLVTGSDEEAQDQAAAMIRGWRAACAAMESPLQSDDAYLTGWDHNTNTIVVIAKCRESGPRAERVLGQKVVTITPDEVAKVIAGLNIIAEAKSLFPDAEVIRFEEMRGGEAEEVGRREALRAAGLDTTPC